MKVLEVVIPGIELQSLNVSLANASRRDRFREARMARKQREGVLMVLQSRYGRKPPFGLPVEVTITRYSPGELDGHDNLMASAKHVSDTIADWFGKPDRNSGFHWSFRQSKGRYAVGVRIVGDVCGHQIVCECCGSDIRCNLDPQHEGPCSRDAKRKMWRDSPR